MINNFKYKKIIDISICSLLVLTSCGSLKSEITNAEAKEIAKDKISLENKIYPIKVEAKCSKSEAEVTLQNF